MPSVASSVIANSNDLTDKIWRALRLVPEFDGNSHVLIRFLDICDQIVLTYVDPAPGNELNNSAVFNGILNKITGHAAKTLAANGIPTDWQSIRTTLINTFSDHRDESTLYTDLSMLVQGSDTPHVFYERVQHLLTTIMTYVQLHENISTTIEAKRTLYKKLALQTYTRGLSEPLGSRIRCMRPESLEKALEFAQEELNVLYLQNKNPQSSRKPTPNNKFSFSPFNVPLLHRQPQNLNTFNAQFPANQHNFGLQQLPNNFSNNFRVNPQNNFRFNSMNLNSNNRPQGQWLTKTQQMMRALPRSNMSTGFKIQPRTYQNHPQPMSGVSHPVARALPPTPQQNIHLHETLDPYGSQSHDSECTPDFYCDDYYEYEQTMIPENDMQNLTQQCEISEQDDRENFSMKPQKTTPE